MRTELFQAGDDSIAGQLAHCILADPSRRLAGTIRKAASQF